MALPIQTPNFRSAFERHQPISFDQRRMAQKVIYMKEKPDRQRFQQQKEVELRGVWVGIHRWRKRLKISETFQTTEFVILWLFLQGILKCYKNVIIEGEKNKVYGLFYGLFTLGLCLWQIAKEGSFHDIIQNVRCFLRTHQS